MAECGLDYRLYDAELRGTGYPMDGHRAVVGQWAHDLGSYHLNGWPEADDDVFAKSMYLSEVDADMCLFDSFEEFMDAWRSGEWEPWGSYCLDPEQVIILGEYTNEEDPA